MIDTSIIAAASWLSPFFFHPGLLGATPYFHSLAVLGIDITSFLIIKPKTGHKLVSRLTFYILVFISFLYIII